MNAKLTLKLVMDADVDDIKRLARDIDALMDLVPEWQQYEAKRLRRRIGKRIGSWIRAKKEQP